MQKKEHISAKMEQTTQTNQLSAVAQKVRWGPNDDQPPGISVVDSKEQIFIHWPTLKDEVQRKLLNQVGVFLPREAEAVLGDFAGRANWLVRIVDKQGTELGYIWFGSDPRREWLFDGLVRVGEATQPPKVWQTFQRYSDGSYRRLSSL